MQPINRWRNWKPPEEKFEEYRKPELTELSKPASVSFVSANMRQTRNFLGPSAERPRPEALAQVELLPDEIKAWDDVFHAWTQARCNFRERSLGSVSRLYVDHVEWAHKTGKAFVGEHETFAAILQSLGFSITDDLSEVYGLTLKVRL